MWWFELTILTMHNAGWVVDPLFRLQANRLTRTRYYQPLALNSRRKSACSKISGWKNWVFLCNLKHIISMKTYSTWMDHIDILAVKC